MNALPPPPKVPKSSDHPQVKLEHHMLEALTDWFVAGILGWLLYSGTLTGDLERGAALAGLLAIAGVSGVLKSLGKGGSAVVWMAQPVAKPVMMLLGLVGRHGAPFLALAVLLGGCVGMDLPEPATARAALNAQARAMNELGAGLAAVCSGPLPPKACPDMLAAFNDTAAAHKLAQDFVDEVARVTQ